jgi:hypothetical protein
MSLPGARAGAGKSLALHPSPSNAVWRGVRRGAWRHVRPASARQLWCRISGWPDLGVHRGVGAQRIPRPTLGVQTVRGSVQFTGGGARVRPGAPLRPAGRRQLPHADAGRPQPVRPRGGGTHRRRGARGGGADGADVGAAGSTAAHRLRRGGGLPTGDVCAGVGGGAVVGGGASPIRPP